MSKIDEMKMMLLPSTAEGYFSQHISEAEDMKTAKNILLAGIILMVAGAVSQFIFDMLSPQVYTDNPYLLVISDFLNYILFFYVAAYLLYFVARILGGKGTFRQQIFLQSQVAFSLSFLQAALVVLTSFVVTDDFTVLFIASLPIMLLGFYLIYLDYKIVKVVHSLSKMRAALSILGFWLAIILIFMLLYFVISLMGA